MIDKRIILTVKIALIVISAALIIFGAVRGDMRDTQKKGSGICLECIGLG
ncbi:MAG: hypothetical protein K6F65_05800 [Lachnospiraceae bacterium]|nr:hypothetical protein [Lachnospiraceae bacterium]